MTDVSRKYLKIRGVDLMFPSVSNKHFSQASSGCQGVLDPLQAIPDILSHQKTRKHLREVGEYVLKTEDHGGGSLCQGETADYGQDGVSHLPLLFLPRAADRTRRSLNQKVLKQAFSSSRTVKFT